MPWRAAAPAPSNCLMTSCRAARQPWTVRTRSVCPTLCLPAGVPGAARPEGNVAADLEFAACVAAEQLAALPLSRDLDTFRPPEVQKTALVGIAQEERCCVSIALQADEVVAYASFHPPAPPERW